MLLYLLLTYSKGGNLLMNIGPTADGRIIPIFQERLQDLGRWLKVNGGAIYGTRPWKYHNDKETPTVWYVQI
jgi:alpha-L-fucosidase